MSHRNVGYIRVTTLEPDTSGQLDEVILIGITLDKVFEDKVSSKSTDRPQLVACLNYLNEGDMLWTQSMDRLSRSIVDLNKTVKNLIERGVVVHFIDEGLTFSGNSNQTEKMLISLLGAVAEFERRIVSERQREGIAIAKQDGKYKGRKPSLSPELIVEILARAEKGEKVVQLAREYGISRETFYGYKKRDLIYETLNQIKTKLKD